MNNVTADRKINRSHRFAKTPKISEDGVRLYSIGKTQKELVESLPTERPFSLQEIRTIGIEKLGLPNFRTNLVINGLMDRNYIVPTKGRQYKRGTGEMN